MRTSVSAVALFAVTLAGCFDQGANAEDQRRLDRLIGDPIVTAEVAGLIPTSELSTSLAESSSAALGGPETTNIARRTYRFAEPPTDERLRMAASSYARALGDAGWHGVHADCIETTEGPTDVRLRASRSEAGTVETALVAFEPYASELWTIVVVVAAPRHDDRFDSVASDGGLVCIDEART